MIVTKVGDKFKVKNAKQLKDTIFDEHKVYVAFKIVKFDTCDDEIYIDSENWVSDSLTEVI